MVNYIDSKPSLKVDTGRRLAGRFSKTCCCTARTERNEKAQVEVTPSDHPTKKAPDSGALKHGYFVSLKGVVERDFHLRRSFLDPRVGLSILVHDVIDIGDGKP